MNTNKFDTIPSHFEFNTMVVAPINQDPIDWPHAVSISNTSKRDQLEIDADDGNQSSYGHDLWTLTKTTATLIECSGRDCFEDNLSDRIFLSIDITDPSNLPITIPLDRFLKELKLFQAFWMERSLRGHS